MLRTLNRTSSTSHIPLTFSIKGLTLSITGVRYGSYGALESRRCDSRDSVITVPIRLEKRLEKKVVRDNTKRMVKKRIIEASRKGSSTVVISSRKPEFNHYYGQSYSSKEDIPLVSKGWGHRKAASVGDYFKIHAYRSNLAIPEEDDESTGFTGLGLKSNAVELLKQNSILQPTLIQSAAIPKLINGSSCLISAETGSGKTLAYLLPIFHAIRSIKQTRHFKQTMNEPLALVLVPSRELADQVFKVAETFGNSLGITTKVLQGGNLGSKIKSPPSRPIDLVVSTINAIRVLTKVQVYSMRKLKMVILDEADTLTDDSFCDDLVDFLRYFPFVNAPVDRRVQIALVSATMPRVINTPFNELVPLETLVKVTTPGLHAVMKHVSQTFLRLKKTEKPTKIIDLLRQDIIDGTSTIVFCNKHETCIWLSLHLQKNNISCIELTAGIRPTKRKGQLESFLSGESKILICTDIGSRGIDTKDTGHVINYDFPSFMADYVHRCGRTGRVGSKVSGRVTNFIAWPTEANLVQTIERSVRQDTSLQRVDANIKKQLNRKYGYAMDSQVLMSQDDSLLK